MNDQDELSISETVITSNSRPVSRGTWDAYACIRALLVVALLLLAGTGAPGLRAQRVAAKTNIISDALMSPNIGIEVGLAPKWTFNAAGQFNLWSVNDHKWRHWLLQPEARYWFCRRFQGHFLGVHAIGGEFNFGNIDTSLKFLGTDLSPLKDHRFEGWGAGAGIGYGYAWALSRHWNIEAELGIGWIHARYDEYPCAECGRKLGSGHHNYFGPTKVAVNLEYIF